MNRSLLIPLAILAFAAPRYGVAFVDQYAVTRDATDKLSVDDPMAKKVVPHGDGFHASPPGGLLKAYAILTGFNAPAFVVDVAIDPSTGAVDAESVKAADLATDSGITSVSFTRTDDVLPPAGSEGLAADAVLIRAASLRE